MLVVRVTIPRLLEGRRPPLDFDSTIAVVAALVGRDVSVSLSLPNAGYPFFTFWGAVVALEDRGGGYTVWFGRDSEAASRLGIELLVARKAGLEPVGGDSWARLQQGQQELVLHRGIFRRAGEAIDAEQPGPLCIEFDGFEVHIHAGDVAPDWD